MYNRFKRLINIYYDMLKCLLTALFISSESNIYDLHLAQHLSSKTDQCSKFD